ncbi:segmentation protein cap'n'collar [Caerostris extrusa]|uniref:Segmentation protein cap'n'collar n=1 Tax=Caerostris extrusa TaxID=172846 RepID=A0AAV4Y0R5_CAEEX|nr:segmentation protein cap'n'collar [Caerostris extrusa]
MYPNMEECWPDTTSMLPLLALSNTHQTSIAPLSPHPMHGYPAAITTSSNIHLPTTQQGRPNDGFIGMLQNASFEVPSTEEEFQSTSISSAIGPSSIGCAVAESMVTLTNDTDPLPNNNVMNAAYNSEFPELMYPNHTVAVPHNELLISDLLLDDDLHLVSLPSNDNEDKVHDDHMDTSNDSVSLTSGQIPSVSDYESERSFSDVQFDHVSCNDQQYFTMKSYYPDISENCASAVTSDKSNFNKKYDYSLPKASGAGASNFLHHNHSYHLPFPSDESSYRPLTRDKSRHSSEDICNKDEKRAKELKLPISINDIINLAIDEYNERLSKFELTEAQLTLIRDIRRRGKNKLRQIYIFTGPKICHLNQIIIVILAFMTCRFAAQNCRKRKMDQITSLKHDLSFLRREKMQLKSKQNHLLQEKQHVENKYAQLYELVLQSSNSKPPNPPNNIPVHRNDKMVHSTNSELAYEDDSEPSKGIRAKRKSKK